MKTIGFVCINYRSTDWTNRFLSSLERLSGIESSIVVVVDNSADSAPFVANMQFEGLRLEVIRAPRNLGYFGGAKLGVKHILDRVGIPDFIAVSNVDLIFPGTDFIERLARDQVASQVGVIAPTIKSNITKRDQNPFFRRRPPVWRMQAYRWIFSSYAVSMGYQLASTIFRKLRKGRGSELPPSSEGEIYAPHGSFMILTSAYFARGGTLEYPCFLFGEEIFVAESCRKYGLHVMHRPDLVVEHAEHVTTGWVRSRQMIRYQGEAARFCAQEYFKTGVS